MTDAIDNTRVLSHSISPDIQATGYATCRYVLPTFQHWLHSTGMTFMHRPSYLAKMVGSVLSGVGYLANSYYHEVCTIEKQKWFTKSRPISSTKFSEHSFEWMEAEKSAYKGLSKYVLYLITQGLFPGLSSGFSFNPFANKALEFSAVRVLVDSFLDLITFGYIYPKEQAQSIEVQKYNDEKFLFEACDKGYLDESVCDLSPTNTKPKHLNQIFKELQTLLEKEIYPEVEKFAVEVKTNLAKALVQFTLLHPDGEKMESFQNTNQFFENSEKLRNSFENLYKTLMNYDHLDLPNSILKYFSAYKKPSSKVEKLSFLSEGCYRMLSADHASNHKFSKLFANEIESKKEGIPFFLAHLHLSIGKFIDATISTYVFIKEPSIIESIPVTHGQLLGVLKYAEELLKTIDAYRGKSLEI